MSFLAPWALAVGVMAAVGAVLLHLIAQQRPAAYLLPTTRFIPDRRTLVRRFATRPRDLLLLALRVLLLLSVSAAFARPVLAPRRAPVARLVVLDRSPAVADPADAVRRARALVAGEAPARLITFGDSAVVAKNATARLDSLAADTLRARGRGRLSAALVAAGRAAPELASLADSVEMVILSPLTAAELDAATDSVRRLWPGRISLLRLPARIDSSGRWTLERAMAADDPLAPALSAIGVSATSTAVRLVRGETAARDSAFARAGGTVVQWRLVDGPFSPAALAMGDDVVVAAMSRAVRRDSGWAVARWSDGAPAAIEAPLGTGCIRVVAVGIPLIGDLPLRPAFQRIARGLLSPCGATEFAAPADSAAIVRLTGSTRLASASMLRTSGGRSSPLVPWLLGLALACALVELFVRSRREPEPA